MAKLNETISQVKELGVTRFYFSTIEQEEIPCPCSIEFDLLFDTLLFSEAECSLCLKNRMNSVRFDYITGIEYSVDEDGVIAIHLSCSRAGKETGRYVILAT